MEPIVCEVAAQIRYQLDQLEQLAQRDSRKALQSIGDRLAAWEGIVRQHSHVELAFRIGQVLEDLRQYWLALSWYQWIADLDPSKISREEQTRSIRAKGRMCIKLGLNQEALRFLKEAEELLQQAGSSDLTELPVVWQNMGSLHDRLESWDEALMYTERALTAFREFDDQKRVSILLLMVGTYQYKLQRYEAAFDTLLQAREGLEKFKDYFHLARCWHNYAELMRDTGRMEEAIAAWRMSLEMKKRTDDHVGQVNTLLSLTEYVCTQNDWYGAQRYATQAIALCHEHRLYDQEILCLKSWSNILFALGRFSELEVCAARAMYLVESVTAQDQIVQLLQKIAQDYSKIGYEELAMQYSKNAVQILS